jgi:hypothetical protein
MDMDNEIKKMGGDLRSTLIKKINEYVSLLNKAEDTRAAGVNKVYEIDAAIDDFVKKVIDLKEGI